MYIKGKTRVEWKFDFLLFIHRRFESAVRGFLKKVTPVNCEFEKYYFSTKYFKRKCILSWIPTKHFTLNSKFSCLRLLLNPKVRNYHTLEDAMFPLGLCGRWRENTQFILFYFIFSQHRKIAPHNWNENWWSSGGGAHWPHALTTGVDNGSTLPLSFSLFPLSH